MPDNIELQSFSGNPADLSIPGFSPVVRKQNAIHNARVREAATMWADFHEGALDPFYMKNAFAMRDAGAFSYLCKRYPTVFRETMTTSDYGSLTVDVLDRVLLGMYTDVPIPIEPIFKKATLNDFRYRKIFMDDGMVTPTTIVAEMEDLPLRAVSQRTPILYQPSKYETGAKISWEAAINDDLGIFREIPERLAMANRRARHKFMTGLFVSATGPNTTLFNTASYANIINVANGASSNNPAFSVQALADALTVMYRQVDNGGDPIEVPGQLYLVYGPALAVTVKNALNQVQVDLNVLGGTTQTVSATGMSAARVRVNNWIVGNMTGIMDPYMRIITTAAGVQDTQWYIFADPGSQGRPALEFGTLRGYETPQLYQKVPNTMRIGGGVEPLLGDFNNMSTEMKTLAVFGGTILDGRSAVASTGAGV